MQLDDGWKTASLGEVNIDRQKIAEMVQTEVQLIQRFQVQKQKAYYMHGDQGIMAMFTSNLMETMQ